jgi:ribosomal protein S21|tara:strand:+ start:500 stop:814 length:315 start_codon:yes stop_codon:yes gene_type:complete
MQKREPRRRRFKKTDFILESSSIGVKVPDSSDYALEGALKAFKRNLKEEGRLQRLKANREYTKPTTKRRKLKNDAVRRQALDHKKEVAMWKDMTWTIMVDGVPR